MAVMMDPNTYWKNQGQPQFAERHPMGYCNAVVIRSRFTISVASAPNSSLKNRVPLQL